LAERSLRLSQHHHSLPFRIDEMRAHRTSLRETRGEPAKKSEV